MLGVEEEGGRRRRLWKNSIRQNVRLIAQGGNGRIE
jgi:hypothetical protein